MNVKIEVYDTISKKMVETEVSEDFAAEYKRMIWAEENNDRSFRKHQTVTSALSGGDDDSFENFHEFYRCDEYDCEDNFAIRNTYINKMKKLLDDIPENDRKLIMLLFYQNKTEREIAAMSNCSQVNVHKKKERILCKLYKLLKS